MRKYSKIVGVIPAHFDSQRLPGKVLLNIGGKALVVFNFEFTFPLLPAFKDLYGAIFYDTGNVWDRRKQVSLSSFQNALGLGLRYRTPLGPIRLEFAWYVDAPEGEERFLGQITIGNVF